VIYKGIRFPNNINTPNSVAKVLNQQAGKLKASELKSKLASISVFAYLFKLHWHGMMFSACCDKVIRTGEHIFPYFLFCGLNQ